MNLSTRILFPAIILWTILILSFVYLFSYLQNNKDDLKERTTRSQQINDLSSRLLVTQHQLEKSVIAYQINRDLETEGLVRDQENDVTEILEDMQELIFSPTGEELLNLVLRKREETLKDREKLLSAIRSGDTEALNTAYYSYDIKLREMNASLLDLINYNLRSVERSAQLYDSLLTRIIAVGGTLAIILTLLIAAVFVYLKRYVTSPVEILTSVAGNISRGNFNVKTNINTKDELGSLALSLMDMSKKLKLYYENLEKELNKKEAQIKRNKEFERRKNDFISIASHELKTPLTSLKIFAQLMQSQAKKKGDTAYDRYLSKMDSQVNKLNALITSMLDITKMQTGKLEYNMDYFDFNKMLSEIVEVTQEAYPDHKINLSGNVQSKVFGDEDRVGQVVSNLLSNAIKYSPDADKVDVFVLEKKGSVILKIKDYGVGIQRKYQKKIFGRFFRVVENEEKKFSGLGIGLYLSQQIVKKHRGKLDVRSKLGLGSEFTLTLPIKKNENTRS